MENNKKFNNYGETGITIFQDIDAYNHLNDHRINVMLEEYNLFVKTCFKRKGVEVNIPECVRIGKRVGLSFNKNQLTAANLKIKENINFIKEKLLHHFCQIIA